MHRRSAVAVAAFGLGLSLHAPAARAEPPPPCGCETAPEVLALAGGVAIRAADLDATTVAKVRRLEDQMRETRRRQHIRLGVDRLLAAEAARRKVSPARVYLDDVAAKAGVPTAEQINAVLAQHGYKPAAPGELPFRTQRVGGLLRREAEAERLAAVIDVLAPKHAVKLAVYEAPVPATAADRARVLVTVNGNDVTVGDVEDSLRGPFYPLQHEVYEYRAAGLEMRIDEVLVEQAAKRRGVTVPAFVEAEVTAKAQPITDEMIDRALRSSQLPTTTLTYRANARAMLTRDQTEALTAALHARLRAAGGVKVFLRAPPRPALAIETDAQPTRGTPGVVTVVLFADLQSRPTHDVLQELELVEAQYGNLVQIVVRDYPLPIHAHARAAAHAAEAARAQGKHWAYAVRVAKDRSLDDATVEKARELLRGHAIALGLDMKQFDQTAASSATAEAVQRDVLAGERLGLDIDPAVPYPAVFVNGRPVLRVGSATALKAAIDAALAGP